MARSISSLYLACLLSLAVPSIGNADALDAVGDFFSGAGQVVTQVIIGVGAGAGAVASVPGDIIDFCSGQISSGADNSTGSDLAGGFVGVGFSAGVGIALGDTYDHLNKCEDTANVVVELGTLIHMLISKCKNDTGTCENDVCIGQCKATWSGCLCEPHLGATTAIPDGPHIPGFNPNGGGGPTTYGGLPLPPPGGNRGPVTPGGGNPHTPPGGGGHPPHTGGGHGGSPAWPSAPECKKPGEGAGCYVASCQCEIATGVKVYGNCVSTPNDCSCDCYQGSQYEAMPFLN
ncbi:MAG: hypothetical protein KDD53_05735 [Bdellovibrionales bacterium]|nr:hypothetical protein [Bdellovibrionales bacterium]